MFPIEWVFEPCAQIVNQVHSILSRRRVRTCDFENVLILRDALNLRLTQIMSEATRHDCEPHRIKVYTEKTLQILDDYWLCIEIANKSHPTMIEFCKSKL